MSSGDIERKIELLEDFEMFKSDMLRKYSTQSMYGYSPRSPNEKLHGYAHETSQLNSKKRLNKKQAELDEIDLSGFNI